MIDWDPQDTREKNEAAPAPTGSAPTMHVAHTSVQDTQSTVLNALATALWIVILLALLYAVIVSAAQAV